MIEKRKIVQLTLILIGLVLVISTYFLYPAQNKSKHPKLGAIKEKINIELDNDLSQFSQEKQVEMRAINIFQNIDNHGFITDAKWYLNLNRHQLKRYVSELVDIWQYRAQISPEMKRKINPQHGDPFFTVNMAVLVHKCYEVMRKRILDIIEIFVTQGEDEDSRALGTYYVLGALTTVNHDAAISLPWLYESFVPNPPQN